MNTRIVDSPEPVALLGGGGVSRSLVETVRTMTGPLVAADGGARHALAAGLIPDAVIGDFDSLASEARSAIPRDRLHHIPEQDTTDFEKCLSRLSAPVVIGLGFMGPRTDHQLAAFHGLMRCADQPCLLLGDNQLAFLCPPELHLDTPTGGLVSLFPLVPVAARSEGLEWPVDGLDLAPGRTIGTSNRANAPRMSLWCDQPGLLVILPGPEWRAAARALAAAPSRWPARAG